MQVSLAQQPKAQTPAALDTAFFSTATADSARPLPRAPPHPPPLVSRYFSNAAALSTHEKTKPHRRRTKLLLASARPHNQVDAEVAAGMGRPDNGPRLRSGGGVADMAE
jgi:bud site selection protein 20